MSVENGFNISTKISRVSLPTKEKVEAIMRRLGHRKCIAYSIQDEAYYSDGKWVKSELDASIKTLEEMFEETSKYPLSMNIQYLFIKI